LKDCNNGHVIFVKSPAAPPGTNSLKEKPKKKDIIINNKKNNLMRVFLSNAMKINLNV
tara:strand:+ start:529 stop:702 length:174 start_codon:yes stop_codon:yes gene_type:complete